MGDDTFIKIIEYTDKEYDIDRLLYCFPGREWVMSFDECDLNCEYGYMWPFPFISVLNGDKGKTYISSGRVPKAVNIKKTADFLRISFVFEKNYANVSFAIFEHDGRAVSALRCFRQWYEETYGKLPEMHDDIKHCFHVRRLFFNDVFCKSSVIKDGKISLEDIIADDTAQTGGSDAVLLFDYAYDKKSEIRCGNDKADMFNAKYLKEIKKQMKATKDGRVKAYYVYFDPYLIQDGSAWDKKHKEFLEIMDGKGEAVRVWGSGQWHPCLGEKIWQRESADFVKDALEVFEADGIYLDEVGNGTQYRCFRSDHNHKQGAQLAYESDYVRYISDSFPDKRLMCEFAPVYDMAKYFNVVMSDTRSVLNIYRFIFPQIRFVRIINCDRPLGHSEWEINKSFFNGEGLWIDNDLNDAEWYPDEVKNMIRQHYYVLQKYSGCFSSEDVEPLFNIFSDCIFANRFTDGNSTVITLLNTDTKEREVILEGDIYENAKILLSVKSMEKCSKGLSLCLGGHEVTAILI